ncbi:GDP-mannose 4,6-dehydratase [Candidatus Marinimicrobia bacterium]|nr:GDP-mannose 4,6-dehydratase [Candidatus Neomarinimicrobiota bacterium]
MKILITGGAGFIGSHLSRKLVAEGNKVTVLDNLSTGSLKNISDIQKNKNFNLIISDILDNKYVDKLVKENDIIYHLAAVVGVKHVMENPVDTIRVNTLGSENVLHSCSKYNKKVLIASTSEVYGKAMKYNDDPSGLNEKNDSVFGNSSIRRWAYATSKSLDEFLALAYFKEKKLPVIIVRFFNTVGPGQLGDYGMVIPIFIQKALAGDPLPIFGDGKQKRSFAYMGDVIEAITKLMDTESAVGEVFNVGNKKEITINELAELIIAKCDSSSKIEYISYRNAYGSGFEDMSRRKPNLGKIEKFIGYNPKVELDEIIDQVIGYYKSN